MASVGNLSLVAVVLGPIVWKRYSIWRLQSIRSAQSDSTATTILKRQFISFPTPLFLPSNIIISFAYITLVYLHLSYLFHPLKVLSRSDLFLLTRSPVNASLVQIRSKLASMSFEELGWKTEWGDEGLETLLRRLGSFDGRKLHLMIGTSPFLSCLHCTLPKDYILFSISDHLWHFSANLLLFGLLTARFDSLEAFDEGVYSLVELATGRDIRPQIVPLTPNTGVSNVMLVRPDGYNYRIPLLYLLSIFAIAQASAYQGLFEISFGQGRWDHWHSNFNIAFHLTLLLSAQVVYFGQRVPKIPAMVEISHLIKQSRFYTDETLAHVQASHLTNQIFWGDVGLRATVSEWFDDRDQSLQKSTSDQSIDQICTRAHKMNVDTRQQRQSSALAARAIWTSSQRSIQEWERVLSQKSTLQQPPTPLASSLSH